MIDLAAQSAQSQEARLNATARPWGGAGVRVAFHVGRKRRRANRFGLDEESPPPADRLQRPAVAERRRRRGTRRRSDAAPHSETLLACDGHAYALAPALFSEGSASACMLRES
jgi:hypothetical protein